MQVEELREKIVNLRREAYVQAVIRSSLADDVIGYIGRQIPVEILYGFDLGVLPVDSTDREILAYSEEEGLCPLIDATYTYARTDKCPLIHSSKVIVMDDSCELFRKKMTDLLGEKILPYRSDTQFIASLERAFKKPFDAEMCREAKEKLEENDRLCDALSKTDIPSRFLYETEFYQKFIFSLDERNSLLKEVLACYTMSDQKRRDLYVPRGVQILDAIDAHYENYRIREGALCVGEKNLAKRKMDVSYNFCAAETVGK